MPRAAGGITGFLQVGSLCDAFQLPLSAHCAPALHVALALAVPRFRHLEYFHDQRGSSRCCLTAFPSRMKALQPDRSRPGLGIAFKAADAEQYKL